MKKGGHLRAPAALPPGKQPPGAHWIGYWMRLRAVLDAVEKRNILPLLGIEPSLSRLQDVQ
jgi:hypothetical protein